MFSKLKMYLDTIVKENQVPACDCIIYHGHQVVFRHMAGCSDMERLKPISAEDKYMLYSATKPMTMVAMMQLIEKGCIRLEDELCQYLPEFEHMYVGNKPAKNKITIEHLMTMSAGFNYDINGTRFREFIKNHPMASLKEVMKELAKEPLDFESGTQFRYSFCHDVAARVIEVVSGMSYGEYMKNHIFEPLGMKNTGLSMVQTSRRTYTWRSNYGYGKIDGG